MHAGGAAATEGAGGAQEGAEHPAPGAPGAEERGVPVARAAGSLLPWDFRVLIVGQGGGGRKRWGSGSPREVGAFAPLAQSRGGGGRDGAWGGCGSARRQETYERGDARRGGIGTHHGDGWGRGGGHAGGGYNARRAPEEEETGVFHPEVGDCFPSTAFLDWLGPKFLIFVFIGWRPPCPLAPAKVVRSDAAVPTKRRSSTASRATVSTAAAASGDSRGAAEVSEPQPAATTMEPLPVAVEAQQAVAVAEPQQQATAVEPQPAAPVTAAVTAVTVAAPPTSPAPAAAGSPRVGGGDPRRRRRLAAGLGPVGECACVSPRGLGGGARGSR
jgi:hypothetical protein